MKKTSFLTILIAITMFMVSAQTVNAQDAAKSRGKKEYIEKFDAGRKLSAADIKFLNSISGGKETKGAMVNGTGFKEGQTINADEAATINKAKAEFKKSHKLAKATDAKPIDKTRGNETCYWYLYCDGYGNCYYIWYCD